MSEPPRVGLIFGGRSVEHEVSVISARGVAGAVTSGNIEVVPLAVTENGVWHTPERSAEILASTTKRVPPHSADGSEPRVVLDPGGTGLHVHAGGRTVPLHGVDVVFPLIHGWGGEDGRLQGALELAGIAYVGAGVMASAVAMDKAVSKIIFAAEGLQVGPWLSCRIEDYRRDADRTIRRIIGELEFPVFVKPCNGGSSVGISKVSRVEGLQPAVELAFEHDQEVVVEQAIDGREIECAVLGNDRPEASVLGEIVPSNEFYDYSAKYLDGRSELIIPAELPDEQADEIRQLSQRAFRALRLRGFARVDFLVDRNSGVPYINEANTLPGFTPVSMFPKLWEASGLGYLSLIERLVALAGEPVALHRTEV